MRVKQFGATPRKWHLIAWTGARWEAVCVGRVLKTMTDFPFTSAPDDEVCKHCLKKASQGGI